MNEKKKKVVDTNLGILLICLFSSIFTLVDFFVIDRVLNKYFDYSKCECEKCNSGNLKLDGVVDNKKEDDIIEDDGVVIEDQQIKDRIQSIMEEYYTTVEFKMCGQRDYDDVYYPNGGSSYPDYSRCLEYNSIDELKQYYNTFLSEEFYSKMVESSFIEHDNKLYCIIRHISPYVYEVGSFEVVSMKENDNGITATGIYRTEATGLDPAYTIDVSLDLIYNNNGVLVLNEWKKSKWMKR